MTLNTIFLAVFSGAILGTGRIVDSVMDGMRERKKLGGQKAIVLTLFMRRMLDLFGHGEILTVHQEQKSTQHFDMSKVTYSQLVSFLHKDARDLLLRCGII